MSCSLTRMSKTGPRSSPTSKKPPQASFFNHVAARPGRLNRQEAPSTHRPRQVRALRLSRKTLFLLHQHEVQIPSQRASSSLGQDRTAILGAYLVRGYFPSPHLSRTRDPRGVDGGQGLDHAAKCCPARLGGHERA